MDSSIINNIGITVIMQVIRTRVFLLLVFMYMLLLLLLLLLLLMVGIGLPRMLLSIM